MATVISVFEDGFYFERLQMPIEVKKILKNEFHSFKMQTPRHDGIKKKIIEEFYDKSYSTGRKRENSKLRTENSANFKFKSAFFNAILLF